MTSPPRKFPAIPPAGSGESRCAVSIPAQHFYTDADAHGPAVPGYSVPMARKSRLFGSTQRHEQRAAESEQRVGDRWTTTGKADAVITNEGPSDVSAPIPDAAKPTFCGHVDTERMVWTDDLRPPTPRARLVAWPFNHLRRLFGWYA